MIGIEQNRVTENLRAKEVKNITLPLVLWYEKGLKPGMFILAVLILSFSGIHQLAAQQKDIHLTTENEPLSHVLIRLRDNYGFQLSYSDNEVSKYLITVSKTFKSQDEVIQHIFRELPFNINRSGNVFVIIPDKKKLREEKRKLATTISGQVVESGSYEPLPYSSILINQKQIISDGSGSFTFTASTDTSFRLRISHLGYYIYDTLITSGVSRKFTLSPSFQKLQEITVKSKIIEKSSQIGENPGSMKLNSNIARFIPGQGDNSVYNYLRLMPGILASGENALDLLIWGSYEGQSLVSFDEFTIFGLKNYNDNINVINPFLVKTIEIYKGGHDVRIGNRVGGIVNITGKNGSLLKPTLNFSINPTTLNAMAELPIKGKASLLAAYRQTYYNIYDRSDFNIFAPIRPASASNPQSQTGSTLTPDLNIYPDDYTFRDFNLKFRYNFNDKQNLALSYYTGKDIFEISVSAQLQRPKPKSTRESESENDDSQFKLDFDNYEKTSQQGYSAIFNSMWAKGNLSKIIFSHSDYSKLITDKINVQWNLQQSQISKDELETKNTASETSFRTENIINLYNGQQLETGFGITSYNALISNRNEYHDTISVDAELKFRNTIGHFYFQQNLPIGKYLQLKSGLRLSKSENSSKIYFSPKISLSCNLARGLKWNSAWGVYNQFMYKSASVDRDKNYTFNWVTPGAKLKPLQSTHWITGLNYSLKSFTFDIEGYYKTTKNLSRRIFERVMANPQRADGFFTYFGDAKSFGLDTYIRKDFGNNTLWASYSLGKVLERLAAEGKPLPAYTAAPQDQRHEIKLAGIFNVRNFYFSADYVYGSGVEILKRSITNTSGNNSYSRFDIGGTWKFHVKNLSGETGISILNLFDTENLKQNNLKLINVAPNLQSIRIYSDAVPFTPVVFLKITL